MIPGRTRLRGGCAIHANCSGFTLFELAIVVALLGLLVPWVVRPLWSNSPAGRLGEAVDQILLFDRRARQVSLCEGPCRLKIDAVSGSLQLLVTRTGELRSELAPPRSVRWELSAGTHREGVRVDRTGTTAAYSVVCRSEDRERTVEFADGGGAFEVEERP